jgi:hypothetical protein
MKPRVLFLMMQYPDVDHLVPVADLLAETGKYEVRILGYQNRVDFEHDPRIAYLQKRHGITVKPLADYYPVSSSLPWRLYEWRAYWGKKCKDTPPYFFLGRNLKSLFLPRFHVFRISRFLVDRILSFWLGRRAWGQRVCEEEKPSVVVIDHAYTTYWIESFIKQIKSSGVPTIAFPHSSFMFTHTHVLENEKGVPLAKTNEEEFPWDCVVVESGMRIRLLNELGIPTKRMFPLGCIRFTKWWLRRSPHEEERRLFPEKDQRPTVLYLASNPGVTVKAGVERLREAMAKYKDRLRFVVKVHSRRNRTELFKSFTDCGIQVVGNEWSSPELINAADYIVVTVTSVIIDAMLKDKPIVYAQFTTENEPLFAKYGVFPAARTVEELEGIFDRMVNREWVPEPRWEARRSYLKECVYGAFPDEENVLNGCLEIFSRAVHAGSVDEFARWVKDIGQESLSRLSGWAPP